MGRRSKTVPLTLAQRWWGLSAESLRGWARADGAPLTPSAWGASIARRDLCAMLERRGLPIPAGLEDWPRILVACDDNEVLEALFALMDEAYPSARVKIASDGPHALELVRTLRPHLVICDASTGRFGGLALCMAARDLTTSKVLSLGATPPGAAGDPDVESLSSPKASEVAAAVARLLGEGEPEPQEEPSRPARGLGRIFVWR